MNRISRYLSNRIAKEKHELYPKKLASLSGEKVSVFLVVGRIVALWNAERYDFVIVSIW